MDDVDGPSPWYTMKKKPKHLPRYKHEELKDIVKAIRDRHDVEMIILFGSHARGDWVDDRYVEDHIAYEYKSDFDILILTADKSTERDVNFDIELEEALAPKGEETRVNFIVHTVQHMNQMLSERRFFFMDILKEGYLLYDSGRFELARPPKELPPRTMLRHAAEYYAEWMDTADGFIRGSKFMQADTGPKLAAFLLHQAVERYITGMLLVHTGYRPKEHDLQKLLDQAAGFDPRYTSVFPAATKEDRHLFDLLRRAYVDARYNKRYRITDQELTAIGERIETLRTLTVEVCESRIAELKQRVAEEDGR